MKRSSIWKFRSVAGKLMIGLVLTAMVGSIDVLPALGDDHKRVEKHDKGRYEHRGHGYDHDRRDYQPYGYAPPPVSYAPAPQPGISIFLPIIIR